MYVLVVVLVFCQCSILSFQYRQINGAVVVVEVDGNLVITVVVVIGDWCCVCCLSFGDGYNDGNAHARDAVATSDAAGIVSTILMLLYGYGFAGQGRCKGLSSGSCNYKEAAYRARVSLECSEGC